MLGINGEIRKHFLVYTCAATVNASFISVVPRKATKWTWGEGISEPALKDGPVEVRIIVGGPGPKSGNTAIDSQNIRVIPATVPRPDGRTAGKILQINNASAISSHDGFAWITDAPNGRWPRKVSR